MNTSSVEPPDEPLITTKADFIENCIHYILYVREVYPQFGFQKTFVYGIPAWRCTHPEVAAYIAEVIRALRPLLHRGLVERIHVVPCLASPGCQTPLESFTIAIKSIADLLPPRSSAKDPCTVGITQSTVQQLLRAFLVKLSVAESVLQPIPEHLDVTFYILLGANAHISPEDIGLETKRSFRLEASPEDPSGTHAKCSPAFPWIIADTEQEHAFDDALTVPLKSISNEVIRMQLWVQDRKQLLDQNKAP